MRAAAASTATDACRGRSAASSVTATAAAGNAGYPLLGETGTRQCHRRGKRDGCGGT
jgi:hypothetical protein